MYYAYVSFTTVCTIQSSLQFVANDGYPASTAITENMDFQEITLSSLNLRSSFDRYTGQK